MCLRKAVLTVVVAGLCVLPSRPRVAEEPAAPASGTSQDARVAAGASGQGELLSLLPRSSKADSPRPDLAPALGCAVGLPGGSGAAPTCPVAAAGESADSRPAGGSLLSLHCLLTV